MIDILVFSCVFLNRSIYIFSYFVFIFYSLDDHSKSGCPVHVGDAGFHILHHKVPGQIFPSYVYIS